MRHLIILTIALFFVNTAHAQKFKKQIENCPGGDSQCVAEAIIERVGNLAPQKSHRIDNILDRLQNCDSGNTKCTGKKILRAVNVAFGGSGGGGGFDPIDELLGTVDFYHDDGSCSSSKLMGSVIFTSDANEAVRSCKSFADSQTQEVWGWRLDGKCENIGDTSPEEACLDSYKKLGGTGVLGVATIYHDDGSCSASKKLGKSIIMTNDSQSVVELCLDAAEGVTKAAWGWSINGKCENISDTTFTAACVNAYKKMGGTQNIATVDFYHDDGSCSSSKLLASLMFSSSASDAVRKCQKAAKGVSQDVWGWSINGKCENITDGSFLSTCTQAYKKAFGN